MYISQPAAQPYPRQPLMDTLTAADAEDLLSFLNTAKSASPAPKSQTRPIAPAPPPKDLWLGQLQHYALYPPPPRRRPTKPSVPKTWKPVLEKILKPAMEKAWKPKPRACIDALKILTGTPLLDSLPVSLRTNKTKLRWFIHGELRWNMIRRGLTPSGISEICENRKDHELEPVSE